MSLDSFIPLFIRCTMCSHHLHSSPLDFHDGGRGGYSTPKHPLIYSNGYMGNTLDGNSSVLFQPTKSQSTQLCSHFRTTIFNISCCVSEAPKDPSPIHTQLTLKLGIHSPRLPSIFPDHHIISANLTLSYNAHFSNQLVQLFVLFSTCYLCGTFLDSLDH